MAEPVKVPGWVAGLQTMIAGAFLAAGASIVLGTCAAIAWGTFLLWTRALGVR